ncbi:fumarylacetoacetate hydrolase family protein [Pontibacter beigongshangensis]|uniref:fumarylacetoacetate hydrolase family protein n=1 Tax=Pontibacter beigongshangensis TaxID=2574733 RepID=UPI0037440121
MCSNVMRSNSNKWWSYFSNWAPPYFWHMMQDGDNSNFIFRIPLLVSYVSRFMTLLPGDIVLYRYTSRCGTMLQSARILQAG